MFNYEIEDHNDNVFLLRVFVPSRKKDIIKIQQLQTLVAVVSMF